MKSTKAQVLERVEEVLAIRLDGAMMGDLRQYAAEKGWDVSERQLFRYVQASDRLLAARLEKDRTKLFTRHVAQRQVLYARAINASDYRTALAVAKDEAELYGLYAPKKIAPTDPTGEKEHGASGLTPDHTASVIRGVLERLGLTIVGGTPPDGQGDRRQAAGRYGERRGRLALPAASSGGQTLSASRLTPEQRRGVGALLVAPSVEAAAELAGVTVEDLRDWMPVPHFQQAYQDAAAEIKAAVPTGPPYCQCAIRMVEECADGPETPCLPVCLECGRPREPKKIYVIALVSPTRSAAGSAMIGQ